LTIGFYAGRVAAGAATTTAIPIARGMLLAGPTLTPSPAAPGRRGPASGKRWTRSRELEPAIDAARAEVAAFVGAEPACSIFTRNATESINLVAYAWGRENV